MSGLELPIALGIISALKYAKEANDGRQVTRRVTTTVCISCFVTYQCPLAEIYKDVLCN
jgi:hypothetical protein